MKLVHLLNKDSHHQQWLEKNYQIPQFDVEELRKATFDEPTWVHFGAGNIFRAFPAAVLQSMLDAGTYNRGVIVAEGFDYAIIDQAYRPFDNMSLLVVLKSDGSALKKVIASVTQSLKAGYEFGEDWERLVTVFKKPSLQMVSFTITEKGYGISQEDFKAGLNPALMMGKVALLLYYRYQAGKLPVTLQSMDNCTHNGDQLKRAVLAYGKAWVGDGLVDADFLNYLLDESKIAYPLSMIDKITPRPDSKVQCMLQADGFEDYVPIVTDKHTYTAPFVNAEETEYLVIEDCFTNGRPPLEKGGVLFTDRVTVDQVEKMKVRTCLNPLHTAMAIFGCLLGYQLISEAMKDADIVSLITKMSYKEAMPVVVHPGILNPGDFLNTVLTKRLPNPFMPDAPQRIATDTSQKLSIRFGETIKAYIEKGLDLNGLVFIPLVLAAYSRYLKGIDDEGQSFSLSPDPLLNELQAIVAPLAIKSGKQDFSCLQALYARKDIFGLDLYKKEVGMGRRIETMAAELFDGPLAVRRTLHQYVIQ